MEALTPAFPPRSLCETDASYRLDRLLSCRRKRGCLGPTEGEGFGWGRGGASTGARGHGPRLWGISESPARSPPPARPRPQQAGPAQPRPAHRPVHLSRPSHRHATGGPSGRLGGAGLSSERGRGGFARRDTSSGSWGIRRFLGTAHGGASADTAPRPGTRGGPAAHLELLAQVVVALAGLGRHRHVEVLALLLAQQLEPAGDRARPRLSHAARATRTGGPGGDGHAARAGCVHTRVCEGV